MNGGARNPVIVTAVPRPSDAEQVLGVAGMSADETERKGEGERGIGRAEKRSQPFKSTTVYGGQLSHAAALTTTRGVECSDMTTGRGGH